MACQVQDRTIDDELERLAAEGFDGMAEAMSIMLNEAMRLDRSRRLGAGPWERVKVQDTHFFEKVQKKEPRHPRLTQIKNKKTEQTHSSLQTNMPTR